MRIYAPNTAYRSRIAEMFGAAATCVDEKKNAEIVISGTFAEADVSDSTRAVIVPYTGLDNIDLPVLARENIALFNTTVHSPYVAEKALHLMFALLGNIIGYHENLVRGDWSERTSEDRIYWESVHRKRIGIYGYGRIGQTIASMLSPFDTEIHILDRGKDAPQTIKHKDLVSLVTHTDIVFIGAPLTSNTRGAFDARVLSKMKNAYLINVGRGAIVEEKALYDALRHRTLKGYGSDVWYNYPRRDASRCQPSKYPLETFSNVVMSPHTGGMTATSSEELMDAALQTVKRIVSDDYSGAIPLAETGETR